MIKRDALQVKVKFAGTDGVALGREDLRSGQPVGAGIDLDGVEMPGMEIEEVLRPRVRWIEWSALAAISPARANVRTSYKPWYRHSTSYRHRCIQLIRRRILHS